MMINSAIADYPDANSIFAFQVDPNGFSQCYWTNYRNEEAVAYLEHGRAVPDGDDRYATYCSLQQILANDVPYIPFYYPERVHGVRSNVEGLVYRPNGSPVFTSVTKK